MKINTFPSGEQVLSYCVYHKAENCIDKDVTLESAEKAALAFDIKKISHGCCERCYEVMVREMDAEDL